MAARKTERDPKDDYPTPPWQSRLLLDYITPQGLIFEPCAGAGAMTGVLEERLPDEMVREGDLYANRNLDFTEFDATDWDCWHEARRLWDEIDWVITNPPFKHAFEILALAHQFARCGVALILRSTFCEPTRAREDWLNRYPPDLRVVMPRWQYKPPSKDFTTTEWFVWHKVNKARGTIVVPKSDVPGGLGD